MKKSFTLAVLIVVLTLIVGVVPAFAVPSPKLRVTYNPMPLNVPSIVSRHNGVLEDYLDSTKVEYSTFLAGYLMTEAMAAGDLDIASVMGGTSAITSWAGGRDIKLVAVYGRSPKGFGVVVRQDAPFSDAAGLKGKRIATPVGTEAHYLLTKVLEEAGLKNSDVRLINMLVPDAVSALLAGDVDAAVVVEPVMSKLAGAGKIKVLRDGDGLIMGTTFTVVRGKFLAQYPETVVQYLRAHQASIEWMNLNQAETAALVAEEVKLPEALVNNIIPKYEFRPALDEGVVSELQSTADFLFAEGIIRNKVSVTDLVDYSILEEVDIQK